MSISENSVSIFLIFGLLFFPPFEIPPIYSGFLKFHLIVVNRNLIYNWILGPGVLLQCLKNRLNTIKIKKNYINFNKDE